MTTDSPAPRSESPGPQPFASRWALLTSLLALSAVLTIRYFNELVALLTPAASAHAAAPTQAAGPTPRSPSVPNRDRDGDLRAAYARSLQFLGLNDTAEVRRELYRLANPNAASIPDSVTVKMLLQCEPIRQMVRKAGNSSSPEFDPMQFLKEGEIPELKARLPDWTRSPGDFLRFRRTLHDAAHRMTALHVVLNEERAKAVDLEPRKTLPWFDAMKLFASTSPAYLPPVNDERPAVPFLHRNDTQWLEKMDRLFDADFVSKIILQPKLQPKTDTPLVERLRLLALGSERELRTNPSLNGGVSGWEDDDDSTLHTFAGPPNVPTRFASMVYGAADTFGRLRTTLHNLVHAPESNPSPQLPTLPGRAKNAATRQP
jgi:hypothetical protein